MAEDHPRIEDEELGALFDEMRQIEAPPHLAGDIMHAVRGDIRKQKALLAGCYGALILPAAAFVLALQAFIAQAEASSLSDIVALAVSDGRYVIGNFQEWILAVSETLPIAALVFMTGSIFVALLLIRFAARLNGSSMQPN